MLSNFDQRADISVLTTHQIIRFTFFALLLSAVTAFSGKLMAETAAGETGVPDNPCYSTDPTLGDSAYWASTAVSLFAQKNYEAAVATVDACFKYWGPLAGQQCKKGKSNYLIGCQTAYIGTLVKVGQHGFSSLHI